MHKDLLTHSPLLALPLGALLLFVAVFLLVVLRTMAKRSHEYAHDAALPLHDDAEEGSDAHR